jgi:hypothetical protein
MDLVGTDGCSLALPGGAAPRAYKNWRAWDLVGTDGRSLALPGGAVPLRPYLWGAITVIPREPKFTKESVLVRVKHAEGFHLRQP